MGEDDGKTVVIVNPRENKDRSWLYNTFLRHRDYTRVNMMLEGVTAGEMEELRERGVEVVLVNDADIVYPEVRDNGEVERMKTWVKFLYNFLQANVSAEKQGKMADKTTRVDGEVLVNWEVIGEIAYNMGLMSEEERAMYEQMVEGSE